MCAIHDSSVLLVLSISCCLSVVTSGLPYRRQERGVYEDIISGADFLSVFMRSNYPQIYQETTPRYSSTIALTNALRSMGINVDDYGNDDGRRYYTRGSRSTSYLSSPTLQDNYDKNAYQTYASKQRYYDSEGSAKASSSDSNENGDKDSVIVAVSVSSSVRQPQIVKQMTETNVLEDATEFETTTEATTPSPTEKPLVLSEEKPSIIVEANKSEFSVEEGEPITKIRGLPSSEDFAGGYGSAGIQPLPNPHSISSFRSNNDYISQEHQTVIFHDNPRESGQARSVSYSTVIQAVPNQQQPLHGWNEDKMPHHERQERHYDGTQVGYGNNFNKYLEKLDPKTFEGFKDPQNETQIKDLANMKPATPANIIAESKDYFVTNKQYNPSDFNESGDKKPNNKNGANWEKPDETYESSSRRSNDLTERPWQPQSKAYLPSRNKPNNQQLPLIYGQPEQNYEVDESVSLMTNGRTHGVQNGQRIAGGNQQQPPPLLDAVKPGQQSKKADDNQKVGYVVEGRNYRKYRVEERTSDGFIVGEYGVVSHDDGSLRGVRYTADGTINPRLIYDALMKFLSL